MTPERGREDERHELVKRSHGADVPAPVDKSRLSPAARAFFAAGKRPETVRVYSYHWRMFDRWCRHQKTRPLPADPHDVANYIAARATTGVSEAEANEDLAIDARIPADQYRPRRSYALRWKYSAITQALAAIRLMHRYAGHQNPCDSVVVEEAVAGIANVVGRKPERKEPLAPDELRTVCAALGDDLRGRRDRALLLFGFAGAFRRGELAALEVADLKDVEAGVEVDLSRHFSGGKVVHGTKTNTAGLPDQDVIAIAFGQHPETCPVRALAAWLATSEIKEGRIFRSVRKGTLGAPLTPQTVASVVKAAATRLGLDPASYSGHSLRAGLATTAKRAGISLTSIQRQGRWRRLDTLAKYIREGLWDENASKGIGL